MQLLICKLNKFFQYVVKIKMLHLLILFNNNEKKNNLNKKFSIE